MFKKHLNSIHSILACICEYNKDHSWSCILYDLDTVWDTTEHLFSGLISCQLSFWLPVLDVYSSFQESRAYSLSNKNQVLYEVYLWLLLLLCCTAVLKGYIIGLILFY